MSNSYVWQNSWRLLLVSAIVPSLFWILSAQVAQAQLEATDPQAQPDEPAQTPQQVFVSARKWTETRRDYPGSSNVYTRGDLTAANALTVQDATQLAPNSFVRYSNVDSTLVFRGLASYPASLGGPATLFIDEVALPSIFMHNASLFDTSKLEVLRGPQATLFGRNTESGAISLTTRMPVESWHARIQGEYNAFVPDGRVASGTAWEGTAGGPLGVSGLSFSLDGRWELSEGYMRDTLRRSDDVGRTNRLNGALKLRYDNGGPLDVLVSVRTLVHRDGKGYFRYETGPAATDRYTIRYDARSTQDETGWMGSARVRLKAGSVRLQSLTSLVDYNRSFKQDFDSTPTPAGASYFDFDNTTVSQDFQVSSRGEDAPLRFVFGVSGFYERAHPRFDLSKVMAVGVDRDTSYDTRDIAAYGQLSARPIERLELTGALRAEYQSLTGTQDFTTPMGTQPLSADLDYGVLLPRLSVGYDLSLARLYALVSRGFLAGGYNYNLAVSEQTLTFDPEYTWNYEAGIKFDAFDSKLFLSLAVFYISVRDKQVAELIPGGAQRVSNAAKAHSLGGEVEIEARPLSTLRVYATFGYNQTNFDDFKTTGFNAAGELVPVDYTDKTLIYAPEASFRGLVRYAHPTGFWASVSWSAVSRFYFDASNALDQGAYSLFGVRAGYAKGPWAITLWMENATDARYAQYATLVQQQRLVQDAPPRSAGVRAGYQF